MSIFTPLRNAQRFLAWLALLVFSGCVGVVSVAPAHPPVPKALQTWKHADGVHCVSFTPDGRSVIAGGGFTFGFSELGRWDCETGKQFASDRSHHLSIECVAVSRDGKLAATAGQAGQVKLYDARTLKVLGDFEGGCDTLRATTFAPDGKSFAASGDKVVRVWDTTTSRQLAQLPNLESDVISAISYSPDGKTLAVADRKVLRLWEVDRFKEMPPIPLAARALCLTYSPDGKTIAAAIAQYTAVPGTVGRVDAWLKLWDVASRREVATYKCHAHSIQSIAFTPDGKYLVAGSLDRCISIREVSTGQEVTQFVAHDRGVRSLAVSADGTYLATAADDKCVKLWRMADLLPK